jgi:Uma2 family endonuclease
MSLAERLSASVGEERFLIADVSWEFYRRFCEEIGERPLRLSFSNGMLEIMFTKAPHEFYKKILAKLVENILLEGDIPVRSGGSMTFQRDDLQKGFEPDECWWIANEAKVRSKEEFDFRLDPPPDLAIEIEISTSLVDRISIFAAMGVPEVWRYDGKTLRFCLLQPTGAYADRDTSGVFPFLRPEHLLPFLSLKDNVDETRRIRNFIRWLREQSGIQRQ